ncbi:Uncharacterised protein [Serratia odorifera]|uniref:Uncharacterized protein n=1 Tax=Serratia odorifera TaxID=618 RepID=A0A447KWQ7_SEROD|nr:Uncharacterised protein [Serratia odorifera]
MKDAITTSPPCSMTKSANICLVCLKQANHEHIKNLDHETYRQASFHIGQISSLRHEDYVEIFRKIETPIMCC